MFEPKFEGSEADLRIKAYEAGQRRRTEMSEKQDSDLPLWLVRIDYRTPTGEERAAEFEEVEAATDLAAIKEGERRVLEAEPGARDLGGSAVEIE